MERVAAFLITDSGIPALIDVSTRESSSAPGRIKVVFTVGVEADMRVLGPDGSEVPVPEEAEGGTLVLGNEFRLELN